MYNLTMFRTRYEVKQVVDITAKRMLGEERIPHEEIMSEYQFEDEEDLLKFVNKREAYRKEYNCTRLTFSDGSNSGEFVYVSGDQWVNKNTGKPLLKKLALQKKEEK